MYYPPRIVGGKERWGNQTDSGQNKLSPGEGRADERSETYRGVATALASQMGGWLLGTGGLEDPHALAMRVIEDLLS